MIACQAMMMRRACAAEGCDYIHADSRVRVKERDRRTRHSNRLTLFRARHIVRYRKRRKKGGPLTFQKPDAVDQHILSILEDNGRATNREVAESVGVSEGTDNTGHRLNRLNGTVIIAMMPRMAITTSISMSVKADSQLPVRSPQSPARRRLVLDSGLWTLDSWIFILLLAQDVVFVRAGVGAASP